MKRPLFNNTKTLFIFGLLLSSLSGSISQAAGELLISPTRVVFDKQKRTASVNLVNAGNETTTYRIEFVERRMTKEGGFIEAKKPLPGEKHSSKMIRFSPRQVTLQPGQSQAVRLMLRKPANLEEGEYRSHLLFRAIPKASTQNIGKVTDSKSISIKLTPVMGISIPVIVRHGQAVANVSIEKIRYYAKTSSIVFEMNRTGNSSSYGDITIMFQKSDGQSVVLRKVNGLAVYTPNPVRRINIPIQPPGGVEISNGKLIVMFNQTKEDGGKLIAQSSAEVK